MVPNRLLEMNLDPYDISVFLLIKRNNPSYPGYQYFKNKIGIGKSRLWNSLNTLKACNIISWDRGMTGKSNNYWVLPEGVWISKKNVDNSNRHTANQYPKQTGTRTPGVLPPVPHAEPNKTNLIRLNNKRGNDLSDLIKKALGNKKNDL